MLPASMLASAQRAPVARTSPSHPSSAPVRLQPHRRNGVFCPATRGGSGRGRKRAGAASGQTPPEEDAAAARADAADTAKGALEDAGDQLADAIGAGVDRAEGTVASTQAQGVDAAARAEAEADDALQRAMTPEEAERAARASVNAAEARQQADSAALDTRFRQQEDAAAAQDAVRDQVRDVAGAVAEGVESVPTPAEAVQGTADTAADAIRSAGQAAGQVSSAAEDVQRGAESVASDLQRGAQEASSELQQNLNAAASEARRAADNISKGSPYRRGRSLISETAPLTSMAAGGSGEDAVPHLKTRLLAHVAGLDRGFAATIRQADLVESAVQALVSAAGPVDLMSRTGTGTGGGSPPPSAGPAPVTSISRADVTSISPEITSTSPVDPAAPGAGGGAPGSNPVPPQGLPLPPPGAGFSTGAAPAGVPGSIGSASPMAASTAPGAPSATPSAGQRQLLGGVWRLVYSSGFASSRSTGGRRPGVPIKLLPAEFGQVYQGIDAQLGTLDNIVELRRPALPSLPWGPPNRDAEALLTLKHSLAITGPRTLQITFTGTDVSLQGGIAGLLNNVPEFTLPELPEGMRPSSGMRSATFDVMFLDEDLRVTRGDRGEIRVFLRT